MNREKIEVSGIVKNGGKLMGKQVNIISDKMAKELSSKITLYFESQIKPKPKWFPSKWLWKRLAMKFLQINEYK